ncbi:MULTISPECIES: N-acetylmuramoyl-L-alanine amidase [unclassified Enterococcus]|uniref:peptidoglycan recognition protein family protein n=1 Tax=unclassified Enterococcus TaxID=2608891 RepID=UPI0013EC555F|nr:MULTISPECIES: N-acetylmuramoyl-L-alanine amidase [unclassified Enterococcus]
MVNTIEKSVCRGVAGRRVGAVKGVVIHNTWSNATAMQEMNRLASMTPTQLEAGFAHYYCDESTIIRTEDTYNRAWHVANADGNNSYLGYEVRGNRETPKAAFLQAEQNACWQAATDLKFYGLPVNRDTVKCHHQFSATECPKRSLIEHCGYDSTLVVPAAITAQMQDYFISQIKKYYDNPNLKPDGSGDKTHDDYVTESPIQSANGQQAKLELMKEVNYGVLSVNGWQGPGTHKYAAVFLMDKQTDRELTRKLIANTVREDVNQHLGVAAGSTYGVVADFDMKPLAGKNVYIKFRRTNDPVGNTTGGAVDFDWKNLALTIPQR